MMRAETPRVLSSLAHRVAPGVWAVQQACPVGEILPPHWHREGQILFAQFGVMQVTTARGHWLVPPERAVWLPPGIEHSVGILTECAMRSLYFEPSALTVDLPGEAVVVAVGPLLRAAILALHDPGPAERAALLARLILMDIAAVAPLPTALPLPSDPRARRAVDILLRAPEQSPALADLAARVGASARTLTRLFPAETGLTFKQWRQRARILAAIDLLNRPGATVKTVAARLGFQSGAAFGQAFRQVLGMTPSAFRQQQMKG